MTLLPIILATVMTQPPSSDLAAHQLFSAQARWIWDGGTDKPVDAYRLFRKEFSLDRKPSKAVLRITADAEYRLFINGEYVARGPAPNPPSHISVDAIDVSKLLTPGANCIGVIVYHLGIPSFPRMLSRAGLIAQLDTENVTIATDASWKCRDAWWTPSGQRYSIFREFTEILDGRNEPIGWNRPGFNNADWKAAAQLGPIGTAPWTTPEVRDIPMPGHHESYAVSLRFTGTSPSSGFTPKDASQVLAKAPELSDSRNAGLAAGLVDKMHNAAVLDATGSTVTIGIDYGREVSGFPEVKVTADRDGVILDMGYGEDVDREGHVSVRRQNNPSCDRLILRKGMQSLRVFHHRAFRYLVMAIQGGKATMKAPVIIESGYPNADRGTFSCSDPMLTKIWEVGRHTMRICMDQGFMDCPWRERGQYIGDGLAEGPVALYAFGDTLLMRRFLRQARLCQPADGLLEPAYPNDWTAWHGSRGPNRIPGYGLLWVVMLEQYYRNTGDKELLKELVPTMDKLLAWFEPHRGPNGLLTNIPEWNFIDWAKMDKRSEMACLNLQYLWALQSASEIDKAIGRNDSHFTQAGRVAKAFESTYWDNSRGLYRDADGLYSEHTNALALLILVNDSTKAGRIIPQLGASDLLKPESPYFEGFILRALCKHGKLDQALKIIRDKWGHMIDAGATTFWEGFSMQTSMCHAWSCTPTALLSEEVLGVTYDAPSKTVRFTPSSDIGLKSVSGVAPVSCGDVTAKWERKNGMLRAEITTPKGVQLEIEPSGQRTDNILLEGKPPRWKTVNGKRVIQVAGGTYVLEFIAP